MKKRMINLLVVLLMMFLTTSSKESSLMNGKCNTICMQESSGTGASVNENAAEEVLLSPINLFMIHAQ